MSGVGEFKLLSVYRSGDGGLVRSDHRALNGLPWGKCTDETILDNFSLSIVLAGDENKPVFTTFTRCIG